MGFWATVVACWSRAARRRAGFLLVLLVVFGCSDSGSTPQVFDASRQRRVFQPPPGEVRAVPPHAIRSEGVGPYLLGASLKDILGLLPHGPRVELMEIDRVVDYSLVKTEADTILIGVQRSGVTFVSVLDEEIARTNNGVGVGVKASALRSAMGAEMTAGQLRDPHILRFASLPNVRFVVEHDRVVAVVVEQEDAQSDRIGDGEDGEDGEPTASSPGPSEPCPITGLAAGAVEIVAAAQIDFTDAEAHVSYGCLANNLAAALVVAGAQIVLVAGEPGKFRRLITQNVANLSFAGFLDVDGDGRHEVVLVFDEVDNDHHLVRVELERIDNGRFVRLAALDAYDVSAASLAWIGAGLDQVDFLLELSARADTVRIGGLYVHRGKRRPLNVAPLAGKKLVVRRKRMSLPPPVAEHDAGITAPVRPRLHPPARGRDAGVKRR